MSQTGKARVVRPDSFQDRIDTQLFSVGFGQLNIPSTAVAGDTIVITGKININCPVCVVDREIRVVASSPTLGEEIQNLGFGGSIGGEGEKQFRIEYPAPQQPDQSVQVTLESQFNRVIGGWTTDRTTGPHTINIITEEENQQNQRRDLIRSYGPWLLGGTGIGGVSQLGHLQDNPRRVALGAGLGGLGGLGAKAVSDQLIGNVLPQDFPTTEVLSIAAVLGAGGLLISQLEGVGIGDEEGGILG